MTDYEKRKRLIDCLRSIVPSYSLNALIVDTLLTEMVQMESKLKPKSSTVDLVPEPKTYL